MDATWIVVTSSHLAVPACLTPCVATCDVSQNGKWKFSYFEFYQRLNLIWVMSERSMAEEGNYKNIKMNSHNIFDFTTWSNGQKINRGVELLSDPYSFHTGSRSGLTSSILLLLLSLLPSASTQLFSHIRAAHTKPHSAFHISSKSVIHLSHSESYDSLASLIK